MNPALPALDALFDRLIAEILAVYPAWTPASMRLGTDPLDAYFARGLTEAEQRRNPN
jgi:hypothetical protein